MSSRPEIAALAGQVLAYGPAGPSLDDALLRLIEERHLGGLILFARNCPDTESVARLCADSQARSAVPLLVMIDQEGGRVQRLKEPAFKLPPARQLAVLPLDELEERVATMAAELAALGIHVNLAPVLDVDSNPANPVIGDRSFGRDPRTVFAAAAAYHRGLRRAGVLGCGKHFPGHGDTESDSHLTLPVVRHGLARLHAVEIEPFRLAIEAGFELLMAAHVLYPALDAGQPASLSPQVITGLLRDELGFKGLLLSDDLEMKAVYDRYSPRELARRMLLAGIDLFLVCSRAELAAEIHNALVELVESGEIPVERLAQAAARVGEVKRLAGQRRN